MNSIIIWFSINNLIWATLLFFVIMVLQNKPISKLFTGPKEDKSMEEEASNEDILKNFMGQQTKEKPFDMPIKYDEDEKEIE